MARDILVGAFLLFIIMLNLSHLDANWARNLKVPWIQRGAEISMTLQKWNMFAEPPASDGWFAVAGRCKDGQWIDLKRDGQAVHWEKPAAIIDLDPNHRWRKYYRHLISEKKRFLRPHLCRYLAQTWNANSTDSSQVVTVDLYYCEETLVPLGEASEVTRLLLHRETIQSQGAFLDSLRTPAPATDPLPPDV